MLPVTEKNIGVEKNDPGWTGETKRNNEEEYSWQKEDTMEQLLKANRWEEPEKESTQGKFSFSLEFVLDIGLGLVFLMTLPLYLLYLLKLSLYRGN